MLRLGLVVREQRMNVRRNIILVGPMGSGKSAVGKQLARALRLPFFDSDAEIERRSGVDIPLIFEKEGEAGFRQREREIITLLLQPDLLHPDSARPSGIVLSTGGGAILLEENRRALREGGTVVYLETSVTQQAQRVRRGERRPLLSGADDMSARLGALMLQRAPLYAEVAAITVQTDGQRVQQVVERILGHLAELRSS